MGVYFIADTHFDDENIIRYENRPFASSDEMNNALIEKWNRTISDSDEVYVLGDFGAEKNEEKILGKLNGKKYLVKGNHDAADNEYYRKCGFEEVYDLPVLFRNFWILSHDAVYVNTNMPYVNLFGHVHNNPIIKDYSSYHFCVSVERIDYTPISIDDIYMRIKAAGENN